MQEKGKWENVFWNAIEHVFVKGFQIRVICCNKCINVWFTSRFRGTRNFLVIIQIPIQTYSANSIYYGKIVFENLYLHLYIVSFSDISSILILDILFLRSLIQISNFILWRIKGYHNNWIAFTDQRKRMDYPLGHKMNLT